MPDQVVAQAYQDRGQQAGAAEEDDRSAIQGEAVGSVGREDGRRDCPPLSTSSGTPCNTSGSTAKEVGGPSRMS